jgi:hypothetical protein
MINGHTFHVTPNAKNPISSPCHDAIHGGQPNKGLQKDTEVTFSSQSATGPKM